MCFFNLFSHFDICIVIPITDHGIMYIYQSYCHESHFTSRALTNVLDSFQ